MNEVTQSLIHKRMKCFVEFIAPESDESPRIKEQFEHIKACIETQAKADGYTLASVQYAGSYAKRTGLRRHMTGGSEVEGQDVDIAILFEDQTGNGRPIKHSLVPDFKRYLNHYWPSHLIDHTKSSATLIIPKHQLRFDVVPMIKTADPTIQKMIRISREERTTSVQGHAEFVRKLNRKGTHVHFNNGLRLVKWWRYHQQIASKYFSNDESANSLPSFLLDLLCAKAYMDLPMKDNYPEMLYDWFKYLHQVCHQRQVVHFIDKGWIPRNQNSPWQVIDPMDSSNNVVAKWADYKVDELARWFQDGRDLLIQAMHDDCDGLHDQSLNCLVKIFGPSFKTQCKHLR